MQKTFSCKFSSRRAFKFIFSRAVSRASHQLNERLEEAITDMNSKNWCSCV